MTNYSPVTLGLLWQQAGGAPIHTVVAVAVALAESGGNPLAISTSHDYGLWQINESNFAALGLDSRTALIPERSAAAAVRMSANGTNWAAWCTTSTSLADCGHGFRPIPMPGSAADGEMARAAAALGSLAGPTAHDTGNVDGVDQAQAAWESVQRFHGSYAKTLHGQLAAQTNTIRRI